MSWPPGYFPYARRNNLPVTLIRRGAAETSSPAYDPASVRRRRCGREPRCGGAGTGLHTAVLAQRYRVVVATDLSLRAARAARLTLALNGLGAGAVVADVANGLRPRSFDLVTANAPWVPVAAEGGSTRLFAD